MGAQSGGGHVEWSERSVSGEDGMGRRLPWRERQGSDAATWRTVLSKVQGGSRRQQRMGGAAGGGDQRWSMGQGRSHSVSAVWATPLVPCPPPPPRLRPLWRLLKGGRAAVSTASQEPLLQLPSVYFTGNAMQGVACVVSLAWQCISRLLSFVVSHLLSLSSAALAPSCPGSALPSLCSPRCRCTSPGCCATAPPPPRTLTSTTRG